MDDLTCEWQYGPVHHSPPELPVCLLTWSSSFLSVEIFLRMMRLSDSSWLSPGPRRPTLPVAPEYHIKTTKHTP